MGLLAGGAARAPRAQAVAALGLGGAGERRHDDAAKRVEHRAVAAKGEMVTGVTARRCDRSSGAASRRAR